MNWVNRPRALKHRSDCKPQTESKDLHIEIKKHTFVQIYAVQRGKHIVYNSPDRDYAQRNVDLKWKSQKHNFKRSLAKTIPTPEPIGLEITES